mgnify:CR=1 FL=1
MSFTDFLLFYWSKIGSGFIVVLLVILICVVIILIILNLNKRLGGNENLKYEFITIIAHKFRTPLTQVKWSVDELLIKEQDHYKLESLKNIQESNEKLIKLTGTLVELTDSESSADTSYSFQKISVCDFVRGVGESFKNLFHEKNIFFSVQCPLENIQAEIDRPRMEFVLQVLFENAVMYSSPGKNVDVIIGQSKSKATISVIDHGIGINKTDIPNVFTKFFRAKNAQSIDTEGLGVGLYLAQNVVAKHKGIIEVSSEGAGSGSTFVVKIPISR